MGATPPTAPATRPSGRWPNRFAYATTKSGLEGFTFSLAAEVASRAITVNAVDPGGTESGWLADAMKTRLIGSLYTAPR
ncbi:MAG TPA: SDR family NAD(P)-dependent oxidoreductase [Chloroflexota bacterium]